MWQLVIDDHISACKTVLAPFYAAFRQVCSLTDLGCLENVDVSLWKSYARCALVTVCSQRQRAFRVMIWIAKCHACESQCWQTSSIDNVTDLKRERETDSMPSKRIALSQSNA